MFNSMNVNSMQETVERLEKAEDIQAFHYAVNALLEHMNKIGMDSQYLINLEKRAYYPPNDYSDRDTRIKMLEAKKRVVLSISLRYCKAVLIRVNVKRGCFAYD